MTELCSVPSLIWCRQPSDWFVPWASTALQIEWKISSVMCVLASTDAATKVSVPVGMIRSNARSRFSQLLTRMSSLHVASSA